MLKAHDLWYGTQDSLTAVFLAVQALAALEAQGQDAIKAKVSEMWAGKGTSEDPFKMPPLWQNVNGVAVVSIVGSLVSGNTGWLRMFGILGYGDISEALMEAAASKDTKSILLSIDSGGGSVNGLEDVGDLIRKVSAVKPVTSHTDTTMGSAAYWIGASADAVYASKLASVGSVGTLRVHTEYSKQLEQEGIKKTLITHGEYKATGNPFEPLSEKARAEIQSMVDEAGEIFVEYVADRRGTTPAKFQKTMGEGRVFLGRKAQSVGLIDGVTNFEGALAASKKLDKPNSGIQNSRNLNKDPSMKATLASALVLALIGGATVESLDLKAAAATAEGTEPDADAQAALLAQAQEVAKAVSAAPAADTSAAVTAAVAPVQAQLEAAQSALANATSEVALVKSGATQLTSDLNAAKAVVEAQSAIVKASISTMSVALNGPKDAGKDLAGDALMAEHARLAEQFKAKFPAGGVAAVGPAEPVEKKESASVDPVLMHLMRSARPAKSAN